MSTLTPKIFAISVMLSASAALLSGCGSGGSGLAPLSTPPPGYEANLHSLRAMILDSYPDAEFPDVAFVRTVNGVSWLDTTMECMADEGFPVRAMPDGGIEYPLPVPGTELAVAMADYSCSAKFPSAPF